VAVNRLFDDLRSVREILRVVALPHSKGAGKAATLTPISGLYMLLYGGAIPGDAAARRGQRDAIPASYQGEGVETATLAGLNRRVHDPPLGEPR
jgi:hypothetical protein